MPAGMLCFLWCSALSASPQAVTSSALSTQLSRGIARMARSYHAADLSEGSAIIR